MKNYDELTADLLKRRDSYVADQKKKRKIITGISASLCCCSLIALLAFGMWQEGMFKAAPIDITKDDGVHAGGKENSGNNAFCGDYWVVDNSNVQSGNESDSAFASESTSAEPIVSDDVCDILGMVVIDGVTYLQFGTDAAAYTPDICLGDTADYEGTYKSHLKDVAGKLYTTKEDADVLLVKLGNGGTVALKKADL